jgi:hypothetical protein
MQIFMLPSFPIAFLSIDQEIECSARSDSGGHYDLQQKICGKRMLSQGETQEILIP